AAVGNPIDLTPQVNHELIAPAIQQILADRSVDGAVAVDIGLDIPEFAEGLIGAARSAAKPVVACTVDAPRGVAAFRAAGIPVYPTPERAVRAYRGLWAAGRGPASPSPSPVKPLLRVETDSILESAHGAVPYDVARELLVAYGVRFPRESL